MTTYMFQVKLKTLYFVYIHMKIVSCELILPVKLRIHKTHRDWGKVEDGGVDGWDSIAFLPIPHFQLI